VLGTVRQVVCYDLLNVFSRVLRSHCDEEWLGKLSMGNWECKHGATREKAAPTPWHWTRQCGSSPFC
jgi:hypothetical protein